MTRLPAKTEANRWGDGSNWQYVSSIALNLPVPTELKTWGRMKASYR